MHGVRMVQVTPPWNSPLIATQCLSMAACTSMYYQTFCNFCNTHVLRITIAVAITSSCCHLEFTFDHSSFSLPFQVPLPLSMPLPNTGLERSHLGLPLVVGLAEDAPNSLLCAQHNLALLSNFLAALVCDTLPTTTTPLSTAFVFSSNSDCQLFVVKNRAKKAVSVLTQGTILHHPGLVLCSAPPRQISLRYN